MIFSPILLAPPFILVGPSQQQAGADLLAVFLAGAEADGGGQTDPDASLGGFRSSTRADGLGAMLLTPIPGVRIDYASPSNLAGLGRTVGGVGIGSLRAQDGHSLIWTPPADANGTAAESGDPVRLDVDETKLIAGRDRGRYLLVTRTTADDLEGQATVQLTRSFNDLFGQADVDVAVSTDPTYRLLVFRAGTRGQVRTLKIWIGTSDGTVRIAREDPSVQPDGYFQGISDQYTQPVGLTWVSPTSAGHVDAITLPTLRPGELLGLWIERTPPLTASPRRSLSIEWSATLIG